MEQWRSVCSTWLFFAPRTLCLSRDKRRRGDRLSARLLATSRLHGTYPPAIVAITGKRANPSSADNSYESYDTNDPAHVGGIARYISARRRATAAKGEQLGLDLHCCPD